MQGPFSASYDTVHVLILAGFKFSGISSASSALIHEYANMRLSF